MSDTVTTEEQAIKLAELLLKVREDVRNQLIEKRSMELQREIPALNLLYKLIDVTTTSSGWLLEFMPYVEDGIVHGFNSIISVNKETGETKFGDFSE